MDAVKPNILLIGRTGHGKSTLVEYLAKQCGIVLPLRLSDDDYSSFTSKNWIFTFPNFTLIDSPGFDDSEDRTQLFLDRLVETLFHVKTIHKIILVQRVETKMDATIKENLEIIAGIFGKANINVAFTFEQTTVQ